MGNLTSNGSLFTPVYNLTATATMSPNSTEFDLGNMTRVSPSDEYFRWGYPLVMHQVISRGEGCSHSVHDKFFCIIRQYVWSSHILQKSSDISV